MCRAYGISQKNRINEAQFTFGTLWARAGVLEIDNWELLIKDWEFGIANIAKKYKAAPEYNTICHFDKKFLTLVRASLLLLFF